MTFCGSPLPGRWHQAALTAFPSEPWRNGGGHTRTIAQGVGRATSSPATGPWDWRVSLADIAQDGPFSTFDGIDRQAALVHGDRLTLHRPPPAEALVFPALGSLCRFPGEWPLFARRAKRTDTARLLNVMTRRGQAQAQLQPWQGPVVVPLPLDNEIPPLWIMVLQLAGTARLFSHGLPLSPPLTSSGPALASLDLSAAAPLASWCSPGDAAPAGPAASHLLLASPADVALTVVITPGT